MHVEKKKTIIILKEGIKEMNTMEHVLNIANVEPKAFYDLGEMFSGTSQNGEEIGFTNYYMERDKKPFFGVCGEFHFSRCGASRWEDELIKMKLGGINVVSTYLFWIHHEEEEGIFDFSGSKNLRQFVELCMKHGLKVILRIGPFDHGEVRNGGMPDWMYGKPFDVRKINDGFFFYVKRLYGKIGEQTKGLYFKDGGPIIGVQVDNEYMHSSAPWEITTGISNEWVFVGDEGDAYLLRLKDMAEECGISPAFYTCTGWGGAATPESMMPLWGGYAFRPWLFYSHQGEHPSTEEYVYQDFHNNDIPCTNDFQPRYKPEERPYACCEMGGGMFSSYNYRFVLPLKSVDAMANIKMASGCNFLGYYMFQGGTNPVGKTGIYMNESQVPKLSYDFQAPLGEFGQVRESYRRLKTMHYFAETFQEELCGLKTVLPEGASLIEPKDLETLRYAVRTDGKQGFVFINNYQDHEEMPKKEHEVITLELQGETITFPTISIAGDENCILPFHMNLEGIDLICATAQPVTKVKTEAGMTYVFMRPDGMNAQFRFAEGVSVNGSEENVYLADSEKKSEVFSVKSGENAVEILIISREMANQMFILDEKSLIFTDAALLVKQGAVSLETRNSENCIYTYPEALLDEKADMTKTEVETIAGLGSYLVACAKKEIASTIEQVGESRYVVRMPEDFTGSMQKLKDIILKIDYAGDIGHAFIDGKMINDNFCNGATWEIGLRTYTEQLAQHPLTLYITPLKEGVNVNVESTMAARKEEVASMTGVVTHIEIDPVYEIRLRCAATFSCELCPTKESLD